MKIINSTWEKRNFDMDSYEILLEKKDLKDFDSTYNQIKNQNFKNAYVVIKLPVGNIEAVHKLEDDGYRFLETQLYLVDHFEPIKSELEMINNIQGADVEKTEVPKVLSEWEKIIQMITPGMFDTDRVSLDPILGIEIASKRYQNWCRDLFNRPDTVMRIYKYEGNTCGFEIHSTDPATGKIDGILGGIFEKYKNLGIGTSWIGKSSNIKATVSSNNLSVLKIHQHCGRIISKVRYVFRKIYD